MKNLVIENEFNGKPVNNHNGKFTLNNDILNRLDKLFSYSINKHNKVFFVRFDVTFPEGFNSTKPNQLISNFTESLIRCFKRKKYDPYYLWVREQNDSNHPHYHYVMLLDGNKIQYANTVWFKAEKLWNKQLDIPLNYKGLIHYCNQFSSGLMLYRNNPDSLNQAFKWASYLAKNDSKNFNSEYRSVGMSRI